MTLGGYAELPLVYSHPRSGTHFLEAFIAENFFRKIDLSIKPITWGHWSNLKVKLEGNPYGLLFGGHNIPNQYIFSTVPMLYIYRDGRAVASSIWQTDNFLNEKIKQKLNFSQFLRYKLDWLYAPEKKADGEYNVAQHWYHHVDQWHLYQKKNPNLLIIRYEELKQQPETVYQRIKKHFYPVRGWIDKNFSLIHAENLTKIENLIGIYPNQGKIDAWKQFFSDADNDYFNNQLPSQKYLFLD